MPYTHTNRAALKVELAHRLGDNNKIFWVDTELGIYIDESLRTFGLCSGFWRERGTIAASPSQAFYNINSDLSNGTELILAPTITDRSIIQSLQYALLESATSQSSWTGTEMFTLSDLTNAVKNRVNQFLSDTGVVVHRTLVGVSSPPGGRQLLPQSVIDVRRAAWLGASPFNYYNPLWRSDERMLTAAGQFWFVNADTPEMYSIMAPPPLQMQLAPIPLANGQLELLTVNSVPALNPSVSATVLGIPDDLTPAIKWGALADLLGMDGVARDTIRAQYAEQRYQMYVQLARLLPVVIHAEINGVALIPSTLQELESSTPNWENSSSRPEDIALAAPNMIVLNPVPDATYSTTLDVIRKTPVPVLDSSSIQVGREQLDMILDYAEHIALFKVAGAEWHSTERQAQNFLVQSLTYNQRIAAATRSAFASSLQSERQKEGIPRRIEASGIGALKGNG